MFTCERIDYVATHWILQQPISGLSVRQNGSNRASGGDQEAGRDCESALPFFQSGTNQVQINALPPDAPETAVDDLATGHRLWEIMQFCAPSEFNGSLPADEKSCNDKWIARHENLKRVEKCLSDVLAKNNLDKRPPQIDLKLVAEMRSSARREFAKLLRMFLYSTSPFIGKFIGPIQSLPIPSQTLYMYVYENYPSFPYLDESAEAEVHPKPASAPSVEAKRDPELYHEEIESAKDKQIEELREEVQHQKAVNRSLDHKYDRLRENNDELTSKIKLVEDKLRKNENQGSSEAHIHAIESKIEQQNRYIEEQEDEINKLRAGIAQTANELNQLRKANQDIEPLRDQVDELQHRYDEASRKANMADKYAQKLEALKEVERNYRNLQGQYDDLVHERGDGSTANTELTGLRRTIDEYKKLLPAIETERHEAVGMVHQAKEDLKMLEEQLFAKSDELVRAEETITELRNSQGMNPIDTSAAGLESEMEDSERKAVLDAMAPEEKSQVLEKELREEKVKCMAVTSQLEDSKNFYKELEKRYESQRSEKVALERALKAAADGTSPSTPPARTNEDPIDEEADGEVVRLAEENLKLKERIKLMETQDPAAKKAADTALMRQQLISMKGETRLMASAWYGLNARSQLNSTILQKKTDAPQGFLGRARGEVERALRVRGR